MTGVEEFAARAVRLGYRLDEERAAAVHAATLVGSYESVARQVDLLADMPGVKGMMLTFDDFEKGVHDFGTRVMPLLGWSHRIRMVRQNQDIPAIAGTTKRNTLNVLIQVMGFVAAALAGTGGALFGVRLADAVNRRLGRGISEDSP
ncbi:hypothetical protein [Pseudonocardia xinjiangensis]|uniref:hypothetical protein n=1 Tax=Pseudonocardia xinjiangensis TaxID=75289 RepID=UPI001FE8EF49|nr:hypothetical protein [Pseudonocardia xinjiangensis]